MRAQSIINPKRADVSAILAISVMLLLLVSVPAALGQAITVDTNKTTYNPGNLMVASGTAPPNDEVVVQVLNPSNNLVATTQVTADASGSYETSVMRFPESPSPTFPLGSYTVKATAAAGGVSVTTTVTFQASTAAPAPAPQRPNAPASAVATPATVMQIIVKADGTYLPGETVTINVMFTENGALTDPTLTIAHIHTPNRQLVQLLGSQGRIHAGWYYFDYTIPSSATAGTYGIHVAANTGNSASNSQGTFQVTTSLARESSVQAIIPAVSSQISRIDTKIGNLASDISDVRATVTASVASAEGAINVRISQSEAALSSDISKVSSGVSTSVASIEANIESAIDDAEDGITASVSAIRDDTRSAASGASQASTTALVAAALAALAVLLEIVILVRKRG